MCISPKILAFSPFKEIQTHCAFDRGEVHSNKGYAALLIANRRGVDQPFLIDIEHIVGIELNEYTD